MKGAPFAAIAARQAFVRFRPPPSGEHANTLLTGDVGAPCADAGTAAHVVRSSGAARATAAAVAVR